MSKPPQSANSHGSKSDPERFLRVDHLSGDLRGRSIRGGAVTLGNQGAKFALTLGSTAVLARILTPEDFGLIAMVIAIINFIATFKELGLAMATVQRPDVNQGQVSTLFWINTGISALIMLVTAAAAPLIAFFYKEPRLTQITFALAGTIILSGLGVQHQALLRRQMRFGVLAVIEITAMALGMGTAVACALIGFGYWSLVLIPIIRETGVTAGVWLACGWRPGRPARRAGVRSMVTFGASLTGFNIVNYFARNLDNVLIGWYWGAAALGLYNKAYQLLLLPIQQINAPLTSVAVPTLSRLQAQVERYRAYYRRGVLLTVTAGMPVVAFLFVDADKAVLTMLGGQWTGAVNIFRVLGPAAFVGTFNVVTGWVYVSLGLTRRQFVWGIFSSLVTVLAFAVGLRWGPIGVGAAFSIALVILRPMAMLYCFRSTFITMTDALVSLWRPTVSSVAAGMALYGFGRVAPIQAPVGIALIIDFAIYVLCYLLIWIALPRGRTSLTDILNIVKELRKAPVDPGAATKEMAGE